MWVLFTLTIKFKIPINKHQFHLICRHPTYDNFNKFFTINPKLQKWDTLYVFCIKWIYKYKYVVSQCHIAWDFCLTHLHNVTQYVCVRVCFMHFWSSGIYNITYLNVATAAIYLMLVRWQRSCSNNENSIFIINRSVFISNCVKKKSFA